MQHVFSLNKHRKTDADYYWSKDAFVLPHKNNSLCDAYTNFAALLYVVRTVYLGVCNKICTTDQVCRLHVTYDCI